MRIQNSGSYTLNTSMAGGELKRVAAAKSSGEIVGSIDDLLIQILLRLPSKSLVRFELVSKEWLSLITKSLVPLKISNQKTTPHVGLIFRISNAMGWGSTSSQYLPFSLDTEAAAAADQSTIIPSLDKIKMTAQYICQIRQSCNGLLLMTFCGRTSYVYNPTTNKLFALPGVDNGDAYNQSRKQFGMWLAFDPVNSPYYKVVAIMELREDGRDGSFLVQMHIYSSENRRWRPSGQPFSTKRVFDRMPGVYWNGNIHWIHRSLQPHQRVDYTYFDMENEVIKAVPGLPLIRDFNTGKIYFGESCGYLHTVYFHNDDLQINVCELRRDYSEWFVKFRVDLSALPPYMDITTLPVNQQHIYAIAVIRGEDENDCFLILNTFEAAIRYNVVTKASERLDGLTARLTKNKLTNWFVCPYIETLCSV